MSTPLLQQQQVEMQVDSTRLFGDFALPQGAQALVVFAHGSGSSRLSGRNKYVAQVLQDAGLATLLFDLLSPDEEEVDRFTAHLRFDIQLLAARVVAVSDWLRGRPEMEGMKLGYFGASTGAAAALVAATRVDGVGAVVSRGGRPDLAERDLPAVTAPTLLIVGGNDFTVLELNRFAYDRLRAPKELAVVPGATHLFEEPGTLEQAAALARDWFLRYLPSSA